MMEDEVKNMLTNVEADAWCEDSAKSRSLHGKVLNITSPTGTNVGLFRMHVRETDLNGNRKEGYVQIGLEPLDTDAVCSTIAAMQPCRPAVLDKGVFEPKPE